MPLWSEWLSQLYVCVLEGITCQFPDRFPLITKVFSATLPYTQHVFCKNCRRDFHPGKCSDRPPSAAAMAESGGGRLRVDTQAFRQARWNEASEMYIRENAKLCPRCQANTEKNGTHAKA